jgi:crotonobetainyl-CoA:carnitine CoA-transferase CaiB-like acyl-CoA transferase
MSIKHCLSACAALIGLVFASANAFADDHAYTEGKVINVAAIRTAYGHTDEYMKYLDTTWKQEQEAAKKAGYIESYQVYRVEPRSENDPDIYLVVTYKNWAAMDGADAKGDAVAKMIEGSVTASNQGAADRSKIRRVLGSATMQALDLK